MAREHDVIVIGAGISGLLTSLALSKEGKKVLLLEKENYLGGVCRSYDVDGYRVDTGPHIITRVDRGPLKELIDKYFEVSPIFMPHGKYYIRLNGQVRVFPWNLKDWLSFDALPPIDRLYLMKTLFSASYIFSSTQDFSRISVGKLIGDGVSKETKRFLDCMSYFMTGTSVDEAPVARFIDREKYMAISDKFLDKLYAALMKEGAVDQTYPKNGIQSIIDSIITSMPKDSVDIHTNEGVKKIEVNGDTRIVATNKDNYKSNAVIYSGFASDLPELVDNLPKEYSESLNYVKRVNALAVWLGLNKKIFQNYGSEIWADSDPYSWVVPTSNYDPSLAPKDKQLVGFTFIMPDKYDIGNEKKKVLNAIYNILPELESCTEMVHYQHLVPEKAAWTVNTKFASVKTPINGLYLVGTDTEKKSMGITRASYSVLNLISTLREDKIIA